MSLTIDYTYVFTESYPSSSVEELQAQLECLRNDILYISMRKEHHRCECAQVNTPVSVFEHTKGLCKVSFQNILLEDMCERCKQTLADFPSHLIGAGCSALDHWHPMLLMEMAHYHKGLLKKALRCKEKNYENLSNDDIQTLAKETYDYSQYLRRTERHLSPTPPGLLDTIDENELEMEAFEFEVKSRVLRGLLQVDGPVATPFVQSDTG